MEIALRDHPNSSAQPLEPAASTRSATSSPPPPRFTESDTPQLLPGQASWLSLVNDIASAINDGSDPIDWVTRIGELLIPKAADCFALCLTRDDGKPDTIHVARGDQL